MNRRLIAAGVHTIDWLERIRRRLAAQYAEIEVASPSDARGARFVLHARRAP